MSNAEFDRHARTYGDVHKLNISASGEEPEYFAEYKMKDFAAAVAQARANPQGNFLDFGSGVGTSVQPFLAQLPAASLVCADVSQESLQESRRLHGDSVKYLHIDQAGLSLDSGSMDGGFACCVFHHIPANEHGQAFAELQRVLKPGAPLMVYEHNPLNPLTVRAVNTCPFDENAVLIRAGVMKLLCERAGFKQVRIEYRVFFPAALRSLRPMEDKLRWLPLGAQYALHAKA